MRIFKIGLNVPSLTWGPREMFSWAGLAAFFGGILVDVGLSCRDRDLQVAQKVRGVFPICVVWTLRLFGASR